MANQEENQLPSHFFRTILSLENARMKIPLNFVKDHGNTMSEDAILQVGPCGLTWKLGVERCEGLVWLLEGWKEFAEYYSIKFGHMLMFRYKSKSKFDVSIFDSSLMEIQYPVKASSKSRVEFDQSKVVETEEEETDDEDEEDDEEKEEEDDDDDDDEECPKRLQKNRERSRAKQSSKKRTRRATSAWDKVLKRAEAYKRSYACFSVRMLPESLLCVPHSHSIRHFLGKENNGVYLKVGENGREWFLKYRIGPHPFHQVRLLKSGWSVFMKDNHLEDGDICVFELINSTKMVYKVAIFRIADHEDDDDDDYEDNDDDDDDECPPVNRSKEKRSQSSRSARNKVLQRAKAIKCQNPSYIAVMQNYHLCSVKSCLYVPLPHSKMYLLEKENTGIYLTTGKDQRTWFVPYSIEKPPLFRVRLSTGGWRLFQQENHLEAGDACVFELVDSSTMEYKVTIFRVADYA